MKTKDQSKSRVSFRLKNEERGRGNLRVKSSQDAFYNKRGKKGVAKQVLQASQKKREEGGRGFPEGRKVKANSVSVRRLGKRELISANRSCLERKKQRGKVKEEQTGRERERREGMFEGGIVVAPGSQNKNPQPHAVLKKVGKDL